MTSSLAPNASPRDDWPPRVHDALRRAGVTLVGYVPDAGLKRLIELCQADDAVRTVPLTTEEEGVGLAVGAWLGGARAVLLMQSSGVGNVINALGMAGVCGVPLPMVVTMRGEEGETNPWQVPMGTAAPAVLDAMGVRVTRVASADRVPAAVEEALERAFEDGVAAAVLVAQQVVGVKHFRAGAP